MCCQTSCFDAIRLEGILWDPVFGTKSPLFCEQHSAKDLAAENQVMSCSDSKHRIILRVQVPNN